MFGCASRNVFAQFCPIDLPSPTSTEAQHQAISFLELPPTALMTMASSATADPLEASPRSKRAQTVTGAKTPGPKVLQFRSPKKQYLILYNFISALLWLVVLGRVVLLVPFVGFGRVYPGVGYFAKWTQTVALLEIVHVTTGLFSCEVL
jgi:hypothetical protein